MIANRDAIYSKGLQVLKLTLRPQGLCLAFTKPFPFFTMSHQMHYMEIVDDTQRIRKLLQRQTGSQNMNMEHSGVTLMSEYTEEITRAILELAQEMAIHRQSKIVESSDIQIALGNILYCNVVLFCII